MNQVVRLCDSVLPRAAVTVIVKGRVQGVGFRPFIARLARQHQLGGWVRNQAGEVRIAVCGEARALDLFLGEIVTHAPPLARPRIERVMPMQLNDDGTFTILPSESGDPRAAELPPDQSVCEDCLAEMADPAARRYRYPFINCTQCGPRYSIIRTLPYDRAGTTMAGFGMCSHCRAQYDDPADRRYHAQPLACPACGPRLWFRQGDQELHGNEEAIAACVRALRLGQTIAVKGVGGYHLLCDAANEDGIARLRRNKRRPAKPFAVMVPMPAKATTDWVRRLGELSDAETSLLHDSARPIVLVRRHPNSGLAEGIAPGLAEVGLMLPYSPLHHLLLRDYGGPLVATSANISGEPVLTDGPEVERRLATCCDGYLHHDRPIHRPADDPVVRVIAGRSQMLRLGRGTAPAVLDNPYKLDRPVLACGGQMRTAAALAWEDRVVVSPHVGDLGSVRSVDVFGAVADGMQQLYGVQAETALCDAHPGFSAHAWARRRGYGVITVPHHFAHASALAGEHGITEPLLVFAWDGLGLGTDGGLWGGEALYGSPGSWRRLGSFRPLRLVGADQVSYEPWRSAAAVCWELDMPWSTPLPERELVRHAWRKGINTHHSSAVGRLFDAAAALLGIIDTASYDGQAPAMLESIATDSGAAVPLPIHTGSDSVWRVDWEPLMRELMNSRASVSDRAGLFHASLAASLLHQTRAAQRQARVTCVGLTGGVFQNRLLTEQAVQLLCAHGFEVLLHERVPPNDGGLSYGQVVECAARQVSVKVMQSAGLAHGI